MRSARRLYRFSVGYAVVAVLALAGATWLALRSVTVSAAPASELLAACRRLLLPEVTVASALTLALTALVLAVAALGVRSVVTQLLARRRFLRRLEVVAPLQGHAGVLVVRAEAPHAFCAGSLRPRVYVSNAALETLTRDELAAVLAHERHHATRRDPLRIFVVQVLSDALFFLPVLRQLRDRYAALAEVAADEAAVRRSGDPAPLAAALLRFGESTGPGVVGIAPERVDHLLGEGPRWELPVSVLLGGAVTLAGMVLLAATISNQAPARVDLVLLAAQSCMAAMVLGPALLVGGLLLYAGKRAMRPCYYGA